MFDNAYNIYLLYFHHLLFSEEEQKSVPSIQPHIESDETKVEPLTVIEQPEVITPQPTANQAMKGTIVLLILV